MTGWLRKLIRAFDDPFKQNNKVFSSRDANTEENANKRKRNDSTWQLIVYSSVSDRAYWRKDAFVVSDTTRDNSKVLLYRAMTKEKC